MHIEELADKLKEMWESAPQGGKSPMVHLFGIRYVDELEGLDLEALAELAGRPRSMGAEIRKGRNLAPYVIERQNVNGTPSAISSASIEFGELRSEIDDFKLGTKAILNDILALLDRASVLNEDFPPAAMTTSELRRVIREL